VCDVHVYETYVRHVFETCETAYVEFTNLYVTKSHPTSEQT